MVFKKSHPITNYSKPKIDRLAFMAKQQVIIISKIWWQVLLVSIYSTAIVLLNHFFGDIFYMNWTAGLVPILGVVTGLLLVFRTNTAYDRYYEGRRLWSQMIHGIRVLIRSVWIICPENSGQDVVEKKTATNFLVAYAIASKHYLREEYSYDQKDLKDLIQHFPQMFSEPRLDLLRKMSILNYAPPSNIPLQIAYYIGIFIQTMKDRHKWDPAISGMFYNSLNSLVDCLSGFERIKRTPIPVAYSVHLYHVIWLYILSLPFQLIGTMGFWTIAGVAVTSFTFLGILEIGSQIEDPFGYDDNDLPLDDLCAVLATEINDILATNFPSHEELFLSDHYFPIPDCDISASELGKMTKKDVRNILNPTAMKMNNLPNPFITLKIKK